MTQPAAATASQAPDAVLSIQSRVAHGSVGNSGATLPLQLLGFDVVAVDTVQLAHHPGYGTWCGHLVEPERLQAILAGIAARGVHAHSRAVLSGYLGDAAVGPLVHAAANAVRAANSDALYMCDPVIGDDGPGVFVHPDIPALFRDLLVPAADVVIPNRFELALLTGETVAGPADALRAAAVLRRRGPGLVVVTGLPVPGQPDRLAVLADTAEASWLATVPRQPLTIGGGTGDVFAALFLGHYLRLSEPRRTLERAIAAMSTLIERTLALGAEELALVAARDVLADPTRRVTAERLR